MQTHQFLEQALTDSLKSGSFIDTKFTAFSRRLRSGRVGVPRPIYANSYILKNKSSHLADLLSSGFSESKLADLNDGYPPDKDLSIEDYSYDSDSDLDDESEGEESSDAVHNQPQALETIPSDRIQDPAVDSPSGDRDVKPNTNGKPVQLGHVIFIQDHAYKTWRSVIFYLYCGEIQFGPLRSQEIAGQGTSVRPYYPEPCSPKSMYRLADKLGLEDLKLKSAAAIYLGLSSDNIIDEIFSKFTSWYPIILESETEVLRKVYDSDVRVRLNKTISLVAEGKLPHCGVTLAFVLNRALEASNF